MQLQAGVPTQSIAPQHKQSAAQDKDHERQVNNQDQISEEGVHHRTLLEQRRGISRFRIGQRSFFEMGK